MIWPVEIFALVIVYLVAEATVIRPALVRRGQEARAANGGRHTPWWWASVGLVVAIGVVLLVIQLLH